MGWQYTIYAYPILFPTAVSLGLGAYAFRSRRVHGHSPVLLIFGTMNVAVAIWTGLSAIKLLSTAPEVKFQLYRLLYVGSELIAPLLLLFALAYTDRTDWLRRRVVVGLYVVPVAFLVLLFTNPYDLVIVETRIVEIDGIVVWRAENGPAYVVLSYVYVLTLAVLARRDRCTDQFHSPGDSGNQGSSCADSRERNAERIAVWTVRRSVSRIVAAA